ncbi:MAG: hypothetical protein MI924_04715 [Chloroflexales bacterium]|nr:hypothetical protein [Chloroflexales bacterium]
MGKNSLNPDQISLPPGLRNAVLSVPSLIVPIGAVYGGLELISEMVAGQIPETTIVTFQILTATLVGTILYSVGDFWDETFFDKLYSVRYPGAKEKEYETILKGKWLDSVKRPLGIYPAGVPLRDARCLFVKSEKILSEKNGYGSYRIAKRKLEKAGLWNNVEAPILISKFMRSFIWPFILIAGGSGCFYLWNLISNGALMHPSILGFLLSLGIALLSTVPYCRFRVEHLLKMYEIATELESSENAET